ncbi:kinetoplast-associated kap protein [Rutstroemia sp. NJR-2017a BVV2]|nr:kinetoplast-associated kap protein [Rutstroemia sp. NJR-2017a BVV2]PQE19696.1 kinetoplast-associated kap protein [Rutstroemia sp. NJR-2017a BVV2]
MSFGFSVGDFITAVNLIAQVFSTLCEAGGSASQYQHVASKLGFLDRAIRDVNRLEPVAGLEVTLEAIKTTALSCQVPLLKYLEDIRRSSKSLGAGKSSGVMKDVFLKMKWQVSKKLEAAMRLEAEIVAYLGAINLLLGLYKIKVDTLAEKRARSTFESLTTTIANLHNQSQTVYKNVALVRYQVEQSTSIIRTEIKETSKGTSQALKSLQQNCSATVSEFLKRAGTLSEITLRTCSNLSDIYNNVLWIRTRLSEPDTRHTWLQEPMRWEDAYGRVFPIPVEFDYAMMEGALRGKFREGRGKKLVERNQWQLFDPSSPRAIYSAENWEPFPGMKITMAMIIPQSDDQMVCPRLNCSSKSYAHSLGGGRICSECKTWFDSLPKSSPQKITEIVNSMQHSRDSAETEPTEALENSLQARDDTASDSEFEIDEEDLRLLKNARVRLESPKLTPLSCPRIHMPLVAAAAAAVLPRDDKKKVITFKDAIGRKFDFPLYLCSTWASMEKLIQQAFTHVEVVGPLVQKGWYDLVSPDGEIILPQAWETSIKPGWSITMRMWPVSEDEVLSRLPPSPRSAATPPPPSIVTAVPSKPRRRKVEPNKSILGWMSAAPKKGRSKKVKG